MRWLSLLAPAALAIGSLLSLLACGGIAVVDPGAGTGGSGASATTTGGGTGTGTGTPSGGGSGGGPPDPLQTSCPGDEIDPCMADLFALTFAAQWGNDAVFVGVEGSFVAGNREAGPNQSEAFVLRVDDGAGVLPQPVNEVLVDAPVGLRAIDIASRSPLTAELLACDGPSDAPSCLVLGSGPDLLTPLAVVPEDIADPQGLVLLDGDRRCLFGDGILCGGEAVWDVVVPAGSGTTWLAADSVGDEAWFVGTGGAIAHLDGEALMIVESPTDVALRAVTARLGTEAVAAGDAGTVVIVNDTGASASCFSVGDDWLGVTRRYGGAGFDDFSLVSFGSWYVKNQGNNTWCKYAVQSDSPVEMTHVLCGQSTSWRILLGSRLYGGVDCEP